MSFLKFTLLALVLAVLTVTAEAAIYVNANTTNALNTTSAWLVNGIMPANLPGPSDTALISGCTTSVISPLGGSLSVYAFNEDTTTAGSAVISLI